MANLKERLLRRLAMTVEEARNEAISVVEGWQTEQSKIASQARNDSRGGEERGDLAFPKRANREKRDCRAALAMTGI